MYTVWTLQRALMIDLPMRTTANVKETEHRTTNFPYFGQFTLQHKQQVSQKLQMLPGCDQDVFTRSPPYLVALRLRLPVLIDAAFLCLKRMPCHPTSVVEGSLRRNTTIHNYYGENSEQRTLKILKRGPVFQAFPAR